MGNDPKQGKIRNMGYYLPEAFMFYSLKKEYLTPVLFITVLLTGFVFTCLPFPEKSADIKYFLVQFLFFFVSDICFSVYLFSYLKELKGESCLLRSCLLLIGRKLFAIFCLSFIYFILFSMAASVFFLFNTILLIAFMIIPLIALYLMFMLNICYILDQNYGVLESFRESKDTVDGYRTQVFRIFFLFIYILAISAIFIFLIAGLSKNELIFPVILYFVYAVIRFMLQRFKALLYYDIEYGRKEKSEENGL